ncbi:MAG: hypothetical protein DCC68_22175 [Planctomycetota bacterium]|nr:MAG: hypothetical protein DCC68_22175 [Planctomycetota bacterium]
MLRTAAVGELTISPDPRAFTARTNDSQNFTKRPRFFAPRSVGDDVRRARNPFAKRNILPPVFAPRGTASPALGDANSGFQIGTVFWIMRGDVRRGFNP